MMAVEATHEFEALLQYLKGSRGFDFTGYKRSSLMRRVKKRMAALPKMESFDAYQDYLEVHPDEFAPLFDTILINVTGFFRDAPAWDFLAAQIGPRIIERKSSDEPIRICSVGCASGEEPYSIAMLFAQALGDQAFRQRVKIYATDVDDDALAQGRRGVYAAARVDAVPEPLRARYFEVTPGGQFAVRADARRAVIFGRHDLVQDAPISRLDLLVCRNTLMYLIAEAQRRILARFHFALNDNGLLFLGKSEMLLTHTNLFTPLELKHRVFSKIAKTTLRERLRVLAQAGDTDAGNHLGRQIRMREGAFELVPCAQLVVDTNGRLVLVNARARHLFRIGTNDLGRPLEEFELSHRPIELRPLIAQVYAERRAVAVDDVMWVAPDGTVQWMNVQIAMIADDGNNAIGVAVSYGEFDKYQKLRNELKEANDALATANEELGSTNEELETTNEELQSTNEELETTNEELQSTNEELETMNEEMQSTNKEFETINEELRARTDDLDRTNAFLNSVLAGVQTGVIVVDRQYGVLAWNSKAEDLWGLRADEVQGQSLFHLDIGLPTEKLMPAVRAMLAGNGDARVLVVPATNRRGAGIQCRVSFSPLVMSDGQHAGVILLMEEDA